MIDKNIYELRPDFPDYLEDFDEVLDEKELVVLFLNTFHGEGITLFVKREDDKLLF